MVKSGEGPSVLVVDADEDTLELLGEYLTARGMKVHTAYAPDEAIALVRTTQVDAVLTEVSSGTSGLELVRAARARARPAAVVATMVGDHLDLAVTTMKAGASDVLRKPYRLRGVFSALEDALTRRRRELDLHMAGERLLFYEAAADLADPTEVSRLLGLLAQVARRSCEASEVAVWRKLPAGWSAVARGGRVAALDGVDPGALVQNGPYLAPSVAAVPLQDVRAGLRMVLAVAGGRPRRPEDPRELAKLAQVVMDALTRVEARRALVGLA